MVVFLPKLLSRSRYNRPSVFQRVIQHRLACFYSSTKKRDPYEVLGVPKSASTAAIKKAYLTLVKQFHPDTNKDPTAKDKFVEVQAAYDILSDDQKRASFDANGHQEDDGSHHPDPADIFKSFFGAGRSGRSGSGSAFDPFADLFGHHAFDGASPKSGKRISEDIQMRITLTFLEAALGCVKPITLSRWEQCRTCSGSGLTPGTTMAKCKGCGGRGSKVFSRGGMVIEVPCNTCDGTGSHNPNPCKTCSGEGIHKSLSQTPIEVRIPAGVDSSTQLVMEGMGNSIGGSQHGNLLLNFKVQESPIFRREGNDIYQSARVPLMTSLLGGSIRIPSLSGEIDLLISPCSIQPGDVKRLKGKGIFNESMRKQGDMFVTLGVELPTRLTTHQQSILRDWDGSTTSSSFPSASATSSCGSSSNSTASKFKDWIREKVASTTSSEKAESEKHHH